MIIVIVHFDISVADRPAALAHLDHERVEAAAMPGNLAYRVYTSLGDDTAITLVHEWEDESSFAAYQRSVVFARLNQALRPVMTGSPVSRRYRAEPLEPVA